MHRRLLGRTAIPASEISLGTVELGMEYGIAAAGETLRPDEVEAARLLHRALDLGINLVDTAQFYGDTKRLSDAQSLHGARNFTWYRRCRRFLIFCPKSGGSA